MVEGECGGNDEEHLSSRPGSDWIAVLNYPQHSHAQGTNTSDCPSVLDRVCSHLLEGQSVSQCYL